MQANEPLRTEMEGERQRLGGLVAKSDASQLTGPSKATSLAALRAGEGYTGVVRVLRSGPAKGFTYQGREGKVARALVSDGSRAITLVAWGAQADLLAGFARGAALRIEEGYAKARDEVLEMHANERAKLSLTSEGEGPGEEAFAFAYPRRTLGELREGEEALVKARLIELFSLKTILKCPACSERSAFPAEKCGACGSTPLKRVDVLAAQLDDGTAGYRLACFGSEARRLAGAKGEEPLDGLEAQTRERLSGQELALVVRPKPSVFAGGFELACVAIVKAP